MTLSPPDLPPAGGRWRDWSPLLLAVLVLLALAFYLRNVGTAQGQYNDFITHWTLARLAVTGHAAGSYDFDAQAALLRAELPADKLGFLESKHIAGVGVSPYPPVMVVLYAPLGLLSPTAAARVLYVVSVALALVSAWAASQATAGRVGWMTAAAAVLYYPGLLYTLALGQNAVVTLALWSLGWLALVRGRDFVAGLCWGLLVYKVHWVVAVGWLPLYFGRWRALAGIAASAGLLVGVATAWLGPEAWGRWLEQVRAISAAYQDPGFTELGKACDLRGIVSRYVPGDLARPLGWAVLALVGLTAVAVDWFGRRRRAAAGLDEPGAANLVFACGLVVPYLFYYDETVFLLPLLVLWSHRAALSRGQLGWLAVLTVGYYLALPVLQYTPGGWAGPPWATLAVLGLWGVSLWAALTAPRNVMAQTV
jgi:hypothetical protein